MSLDPVSLGITVALSAANMAMTASRRIEGQRLTDLSVTVADYGTSFNYLVGRRVLQGIILFAEDLQEHKHTTKTKGGKYANYSYTWTGAVMHAGQPGAVVTRIWADDHLVYDVTGAGPVTPFAVADGFNLADSIRFYTGEEGQLPDPRMQASVEAKLGPGSCPAYLNRSYTMFVDLPVDKFGNRPPQWSFEVVANPAPHYPYETFTAGVGLGSAIFSPDRSRFLINSGATYEMWDCASRSRIIAGTFPESIGGPAVANDGTIFGLDGSGNTVSFTPDGLALAGSIPAAAGFQGSLAIYGDGQGKQHVVTFPQAFIAYFTTFTIGLIGTPSVITTTDIGDLTGWTPRGGCTDSYGDVWVAGSIAGFFSGWDDLYLYRVVDTDARPGSSGFAHLNHGHFGNGTSTAIVHSHGKFFVHWGGSRLIVIDDETMTIVDDIALSDNVGGGGAINFRNAVAGADSIWVGYSEISLTDGSTIRTVAPFDWKVEDSNSGPVYDVVNNALIAHPQFSAELTWRYLDRVGSDGTTLGDAVNAVAAMARIAPGDMDTSLLTAPLDGWSWSQGDGKNALALLDLYDVDPREHGFVLAFQPRGDEPGGVIDMADFVRGEQDEEPTHTIDPRAKTELPRRLTLTFSDVDADQKPNSATPRARPVELIDSVNELAIDMTPWAADVDTARRYTERLHRRMWFDRESYSFGLTAQHIGIEPGDVRTLNFDGQHKVARLTLISFDADEVMRIEAVRDDPTVALLSAQSGAPSDGHTPSVILVATPSKGFVLDLPLIRDADNDVNPSLYVGAAPYVAGTWPGATMLRSLDAGATYEEEFASVPSSAPATWGYAADALGDADPWLWDRGNSVTVTLQYGTMTGATEAECDMNPLRNLAALGGELIQFTTPTLNGDGTWTLTGLKRGRRGTEGTCGGHAAGDTFVLMDATGKVAMGASDVGDTEYFKAVTAGRDPSSAFVLSLPFTGASLKPYAPTRLRAVKDPVTGDWAIDWIRRSRIAGSSAHLTAPALGEASEEYALDVIDGGGAVVRTYTGLTSPSAAYSEADQVSDGGDVAVGDLNLAVCQVSQTVGRGFAAMGTF